MVNQAEKYIFVLIENLQSVVVKDDIILETLQKDRNTGGDLLFERYYKPLVFFADSMISNLVDAEDLVQEVFYRFMKGEVYRTIVPDTLATYLFRSVKNACLNKLKHKKMVSSELNKLRYDLIEEESPTIDPELIFNIYRAIEELPPKTRLVVREIFIKGKKYKEVASEQQISINTVKTLLNSGLTKLRSLFSHSILLLLLIKYVRNVKK